MNKAPRISIVTISFNQKNFLKQAVESVITQKTPAIEYIVVDPGSTDGSRELLREYESAIDHLVLEPDAGSADGLNKGFALATGEIGYFLNSDDVLLPGALARLSAAWSSPEASVLLGGGWIIDGAGLPLREVQPNLAVMSLQGVASGRAVFFQQGMSFRMADFRRVGGFNPTNRSCWDAELFADLLIAGGTAARLPFRIGSFRIHPSSISGGVGGDAMARTYASERARINEKITAHLLARGDPLSWFERVKFLLDGAARSLVVRLDKRIGVLMRRRWRSDMAMRDP